MENSHNTDRPLPNDQLWADIQNLPPATQVKPDSPSEHHDDQPDVALILPAAEAGEGGKGGEGGEVAEVTEQPVVEAPGKGGEEGVAVADPVDQVEGETPPLPPSPSFSAPLRANVAPVRPVFSAEGTFFPAPAKNPVLGALKAQSLYLAAQPDGQHSCRCAFEHEHVQPDQPYTAVYSEPDLYNSLGRYRCSASHETPKGILDLLARLEILTDEARCKPMIRVQVGEINAALAAAEFTLACMGKFYQFEGSVVTLRQKNGNPVIEVLDEPAITKALAAGADWEKWDARSRNYTRSDPAPRVCQLLHKARAFSMLPDLKGLARQPYFDPSTGELIRSAGYDARTGIYASFDPAAFPIAKPTRENAQAALAELQGLLSEFHFAAPEDRSAALCAMLTAAVRASLPLAPAVNVTATTSGSGKSYLAAGLVAFSGPGQPLTMSYPADSVEAGKAMLSALMTGPASVMFDDMQGDWMPYGVMNRLLTSETISDRLLSTNRVGTARTQAFIIGTGNNIGPVRDMIRRVLTIRLAPPSSAPATLRYNDRPVERLLAARGNYVAHALTIVQTYLQAGAPKAGLSPIGSYEPWSAMCREPLVWLGLPDPATSLLQQLREDPDLSALAAFLRAWQAKFWETPVPVRRVIKEATENLEGRLYEALTDLPVTERGYINPSKFGWFLKKNEGRIADGLAIFRVNASERTAWKVVMVDDRGDYRPAAPPSPSSPPFSSPAQDDDDEIVF